MLARMEKGLDSYKGKFAVARHQLGLLYKQVRKKSGFNLILSLKGLCHGQKCLHLFSDSEAYRVQMGPIASSNGGLVIALSNAHT